MRFVVASILFHHLLEKTLFLIDGIIELGKGISEFAADNKEFKTIDNLGIFIIFTRQGRNFGRISGNKRRIPQMRFGNGFEDLGEELAVTGRKLDVQAESFADFNHGSVIFEQSRIDIAVLDDRFADGETIPGSPQIDLAAAIADLLGAEDRLRDMADELFSKIHQVFVGGVSLIKLHHGELRIVADRDPLIAEVAVDLEDPVKTADNQAFEIKFRRNAQKKLHVESIMMGGKRARRGAAGNRMHHRRFDFVEIVLHHEVADGADNAAPFFEDFAHLGINDQVEITLPIAGLDISQTVPLFRQRQQRLGEETQGCRPQGEFTGLGTKRGAAGANDIADIDALEELKGFLADVVATDIDLGATAAVLQLNESGLAKITSGHDPAGHGILRAASFQSRSIVIKVSSQELFGGMGDRKIVGKGINPLFAKFRQLGAALQQEIV